MVHYKISGVITWKDLYDTKVLMLLNRIWYDPNKLKSASYGTWKCLTWGNFLYVIVLIFKHVIVTSL